MRWSAGSRDNIEDARGRSGFGMGGGVPIGIGGFLVLLVLKLGPPAPTSCRS